MEVAGCLVDITKKGNAESQFDQPSTFLRLLVQISLFNLIIHFQFFLFLF